MTATPADRMLTTMFRRDASGWLDRRGVRVSGDRPTGIDATTGAPYVTYESLYQAGDTVQQALDRATGPSVVTFPEGQFQMDGFNQNRGSFDMRRAKIWGLVGSGRGDLSGTSGTIFSVREGSSTLVPGDSPVPISTGTTQTVVIRAVNTEGGCTLRNLQVRGTEQGHRFHGVQIFNPLNGPVLVEDVFVCGWFGDGGYPPYETFGLSVYMGNGTHRATVRRVEADGRRSRSDSFMYGAAGITLGKCVDSVLEDSWGHHTEAAGITLYHTYGLTVRRCRTGSVSAADLATLQAAGNVWGTVTADNDSTSEGSFNCECNDNMTVIDGVFLKPLPLNSLPIKPHITFSNADHTDTWDGTVYDTTDGSLTVINPSGTDNLRDDRLCVESWGQGCDGENFSTMATAPIVRTTGGALKQFRWATPTGHQIIN